MKNKFKQTIILSLLFFLCLSVLTAQEENHLIIPTEEIGNMEPQRFIDTYDYVFRTRQETKHLFKINLLELLPKTITSSSYSSQFLSINQQLEISYERKLSQSFSLNSTLGANWGVATRIDPEKSLTDYIYVWTNNGISVSLEPRWYFQMKKRIKDGWSANNMTGNYLGLKTGYQRGNSKFVNHLLEQPQTTALFHTNSFYVNLNFGLQRRIFKKGFIDFNIFTGVRHLQSNSIDQQLDEFITKKVTLNYGINLAMGLALTNQYEGAVEKCGAFKCFREENKLFKIGIINLISGTSSGGFNGRINLGYETKINQSSWSLNNQVLMNYYAQARNTLFDLSFSISYGLTIEPRYYYNLKKRILTGKSANNLSACYMGLRFHTAIQESSVSHVLSLTASRVEQYYKTDISTALVWGIQQRIFANGFFDYKIGLGARTTEYIERNGAETHNVALFNNLGAQFVSELNIGFAF